MNTPPLQDNRGWCNRQSPVAGAEIACWRAKREHVMCRRFRNASPAFVMRQIGTIGVSVSREHTCARGGGFRWAASPTGAILRAHSFRGGLTMKLLFASAVVALTLLAVAPLGAHHSWPVSFERLVTVKGTVKQIEWANPHPMFTLDVRAEDGKMEQWLIGGPAITRMEANGWTKTTIKVGDVMTGTGYQFADGQKIIRLERVVLPDGKEMRVYAR
jgi:hypothetical protein